MKKPKFTKPQQLMFDRFQNGERIIHLNPKGNDGGRYEWVRKNGEASGELCHYKTFWNMIFAIYGYNGCGKENVNKYFINE